MDLRGQQSRFRPAPVAKARTTKDGSQLRPGPCESVRQLDDVWVATFQVQGEEEMGVWALPSCVWG